MPIMRPFNPWENGDPFATSERLESGEGFKLLQWPIKLWKISETAPYFHRAHLLVVADCAALCHVNRHDYNHTRQDSAAVLPGNRLRYLHEAV